MVELANPLPHFTFVSPLFRECPRCPFCTWFYREPMSEDIRQLKNGQWLVRVEAGRDPVIGCRIQKSKSVVGSKRDAKNDLQCLQAEVQRAPAPSSKMTLNELCATWIESPTKSG